MGRGETMKDDVLFSGDGVHITRSIARFGTITYQIAAINSVQILSKKAMGALTVPIWIGGFVLTVIIAIAYPGILLTLACTTAFVVGGAFFSNDGAPYYVLLLKTSSGDVQAHTSKNVDAVYGMQDAIIKAISPVLRRASRLSQRTATSGDVSDR
jgi:hypothetical protein